LLVILSGKPSETISLAAGRPFAGHTQQIKLWLPAELESYLKVSLRFLEIGYGTILYTIYYILCAVCHMQYTLCNIQSEVQFMLANIINFNFMPD